MRVYSGFDELPSTYASAFNQTGSMDFHLSLPWFLNFVRTAIHSDDGVLLCSVETSRPMPKAIELLPMKRRAVYADSQHSPARSCKLQPGPLCDDAR